MDWEHDYRRSWDRSHARAFMLPDAPGWTPDVIDETHYIEIVPISQAVQINWMRDFTARQE